MTHVAACLAMRRDYIGGGGRLMPIPARHSHWLTLSSARFAQAWASIVGPLQTVLFMSNLWPLQDVTNVPNPGSRQRKASPPPPAERSNGRHAHQRGAEPTKHRHQQQQKQAATAGVAASGGAEENRERMCEDVFGDWEEV